MTVSVLVTIIHGKPRSVQPVLSSEAGAGAGVCLGAAETAPTISALSTDVKKMECMMDYSFIWKDVARKADYTSS